jgi:hypothetical protein
VLGPETETGVLVELDDDGSRDAVPATKSIHYRTLVEPTEIVESTLPEPATTTSARPAARMARR